MGAESPPPQGAEGFCVHANTLITASDPEQLRIAPEKCTCALTHVVNARVFLFSRRRSYSVLVNVLFFPTPLLQARALQRKRTASHLVMTHLVYVSHADD
eukprot:705716-Prorocentrum_minimum.AAC.6